MKKRIILLSVMFILLGLATITFTKIIVKQEKEKLLKESDIKTLINGHFISCDNDDCLEMSYDKKENYFCVGKLQSDAAYCGEINSESKLTDNRYDLIILHNKVECDLSKEECEVMCNEIDCEESSRTYSIDISEISKNIVYVKLYGYEGFLDKYTSFENWGDYTYDSDLKNEFKNNRIIMQENS